MPDGAALEPRRAPRLCRRAIAPALLAKLLDALEAQGRLAELPVPDRLSRPAGAGARSSPPRSRAPNRYTRRGSTASIPPSAMTAASMPAPASWRRCATPCCRSPTSSRPMLRAVALSGIAVTDAASAVAAVELARAAPGRRHLGAGRGRPRRAAGDRRHALLATDAEVASPPRGAGDLFAALFFGQ